MREITLRTDRKTQLVEITDLVRDALGDPNGASAALVYVPHTTAGVTINETHRPQLVDDLENALREGRRRRLGVEARGRRRAERAVARARVARVEPAGADSAARTAASAWARTRASSSASSTGRVIARSTSRRFADARVRWVSVAGAAIACAALCASAAVGDRRGRHPPDPARRRDHAGEPLVRLVLRHVSGGRRHPDGTAPRVRSRTRSTHRCQRPYHDTADRNAGGPHEHADALRDIDGGKMDGFVVEARRGAAASCRARHRCAGRARSRRRRPTSWAITTGARSRTTGRMRGTSCSRTTCSSRTARGACRRTCSWSRLVGEVLEEGRPDELPPRRAGARLAAGRRRRTRPAQCPTTRGPTSPTFCTSNHVSWGYYVVEGRRSPTAATTRCSARRYRRTRRRRGSGTRCRTSTTVREDGQLGERRRRSQDFYTAARARARSRRLVGHARAGGERPSARAHHRGPDVRHQPDRRRSCASPDWDSTAIFLAWDDWGGFYDHVVPPTVDGAGLRPARSRARDQSVREAAATSTTRC